MELTLTPWLIPALALLVGGVLGFLLGRLIPSPQKAREQRELDELKERFDSYQSEVVSHINTSANLLHKLSQTYQDVQEHLADSANRLAPDETSRQRMLGALTLEEGKNLRERLTPPKSHEAPKDYAPKEADEPGMLDEQFSVKR